MHNVLLSTEQQKNITSLIAAAKKKKHLEKSHFLIKHILRYLKNIRK